MLGLALDLQMAESIMTKSITPPPRRPLNEHQRPLWIIIFAILLASIAIRTNGQGIADSPPQTPSSNVTEVRFGDRTYFLEKAPVPTTGRGSADSSEQDELSLPWTSRGSLSSARPKYAFVSAELAQFDSDADPDGWRAKVYLLDRDDQPVRVRRATAKFELMPRLPTHDFTGYVDANLSPIVWSVPLTFADDGTATARLPLQNRIAPLVGWPSTSHPAVGQAGGFYSQRRGIIRHTTPSMQSRTAVTDVRRRGGARDAIGMASFGELSVRVSVPGEGVFAAVCPVELRMPVLVDTRWPYQ